MVDIEFLRPESWLLEHRWRPGLTVRTPLPETNLAALTHIHSITPAPTPAPGPGRLVTGRYTSLLDLIAVCEDFLFSFYGNRVCSFTLRKPGIESVPKISFPKIYVKIIGQKDLRRPVFLPEFPESLVEKIFVYKAQDVQHRKGINYCASGTLVAVGEMTSVHGALHDFCFRDPFTVSAEPLSRS